MNSTWKEIIKGPRWAKFPTALKDAAFAFDLDIKIEVDKHLLRETVRFEVSGESQNVEMFKRAVIQAVKSYNE